MVSWFATRDWRCLSMKSFHKRAAWSVMGLTLLIILPVSTFLFFWGYTALDLFEDLYGYTILLVGFGFYFATFALFKWKYSGWRLTSDGQVLMALAAVCLFAFEILMLIISEPYTFFGVSCVMLTFNMMPLIYLTFTIIQGYSYPLEAYPQIITDYTQLAKLVMNSHKTNTANSLNSDNPYNASSDTPVNPSAIELKADEDEDEDEEKVDQYEPNLPAIILPARFGWTSEVMIRCSLAYALALAILVGYAFFVDEMVEGPEYLGWLTNAAVVILDLAVLTCVLNGKIKSTLKCIFYLVLCRFSIIVFGADYYFIGHSLMYVCLSLLFGQAILNSNYPLQAPDDTAVDLASSLQHTIGAQSPQYQLDSSAVFKGVIHLLAAIRGEAPSSQTPSQTKEEYKQELNLFQRQNPTLQEEDFQPYLTILSDSKEALNWVVHDEKDDEQDDLSAQAEDDQGLTGRSQGITRALLVGINYQGTKSQLSGCINDVKNMSQTMASMGFELKQDVNTRILTEEHKRLPTKREILNGMKWLTRDAKAGDVFWFHYSGHGTQVRDTNGDEADGKDEAICPLDYAKAGMITDDEMGELLVNPLPPGATIYCVFDCCHSGTILDLRYCFDEARYRFSENPHEPKAKGNVYCITGCQNVQTSADLKIIDAQGKDASVGALTSTLLPLFSKKLAWGQLITETRKGLKSSRMSQIPQFEVGRNIDLKEFAFDKAFPTKIPQLNDPEIPEGWEHPTEDIPDDAISNTVLAMRKQQTFFNSFKTKNPVVFQAYDYTMFSLRNSQDIKHKALYNEVEVSILEEVDLKKSNDGNKSALKQLRQDVFVTLLNLTRPYLVSSSAAADNATEDELRTIQDKLLHHIDVVTWAILTLCFAVDTYMSSEISTVPPYIYLSTLLIPLKTLINNLELNLCLGGYSAFDSS